MQTEVFSEIFPLMSTANPQTLEWLFKVATMHQYPVGRAVLMEESWGNAVYFIVSGWVKVRRTNSEDTRALAILGKGDFFGEMAILDESPRSTDVIALSPVELISISRESFIQILFKDPQLHHRMLQLMVQRIRYVNLRLQMRTAPPAVKLAHTLISLGDSYGEDTQQGKNIHNIPFQDLADVTDIGIEETNQIMKKLDEKGWININTTQNLINLINFQQLVKLAGKI